MGIALSSMGSLGGRQRIAPSCEVAAVVGLLNLPYGNAIGRDVGDAGGRKGGR